jgi:hypothetical protein
MTGIRYVAVGILGVSGAVLASRALAGPFQIASVHVSSPLNAQSVFGLAATALLFVNGRSGAPPMVEPRAKGQHLTLWLLAVLLATLAVLWPATRFPLVFDDYTLVQQAHGGNPWYAFTHGGGDGFVRPIGYLSLYLDGLWAGSDIIRWHVSGLALHLANIVLVWRLACTLLENRWAALLAAALFALHGLVLFDSTYLAARFDVLAVFLTLMGLVLFCRYLDRPNGFVLAGSFVCMVLAPLTKEIGFAFPLLATLIAGRRAWNHRRALAAYFVLAAAVFGYRYFLLRGIGGYRDPTNGSPQIISATWLGYLKGFTLRVWSAFYFPVNWSHELPPWLLAALLVYLVALAWLGIRSRAGRRPLGYALAFTGIALLPIAHLLLTDARLTGAWRFYLALPGFTMFLAAAVYQNKRPTRWLLSSGLLVFQFAALANNLTIWRNTARLVDRTCAEAAAIVHSTSEAPFVPNLPREVDGVPFLGTLNGFGPCVAFHGAPADNYSGATSVKYLWDSANRRIVPARPSIQLR